MYLTGVLSELVEPDELNSIMNTKVEAERTSQRRFEENGETEHRVRDCR